MIWPLVAYFAFVVVLVAVIIILSYLLGQRHFEPPPASLTKGGIVSEGSARVRFSVHYYLIAMFFVVFDLEAVFLFAWAGAARELGWAGYLEVVLFVGVLVAAATIDDHGLRQPIGAFGVQTVLLLGSSVHGFAE